MACTVLSHAVLHCMLCCTVLHQQLCWLHCYSIRSSGELKGFTSYVVPCPVSCLTMCALPSMVDGDHTIVNGDRASLTIVAFVCSLQQLKGCQGQLRAE